MPRKAGTNSRCPFYRGSSLLKMSLGPALCFCLKVTSIYQELNKGCQERRGLTRGPSLLKVSFKREWTVHLQVDGRNGFYGVLLDLHNLSGHMKPKSNHCLLFNVT